MERLFDCRDRVLVGKGELRVARHLAYGQAAVGEVALQMESVSLFGARVRVGG